MNEEAIMKIFEMISAAGTARSKYIEAISTAKTGDFEKAADMVKEGGACFLQAHHVHGELLAADSAKMEEAGEGAGASLILVHAEDQMMAAESFRLMAEEFIDVYKQLDALKQQTGLLGENI